MRQQAPYVIRSMYLSGNPVVVSNTSEPFTRTFGFLMYSTRMFLPGTMKSLMIWSDLPVGVGVGFTCPAVVLAEGLNRHELRGNHTAEGPMVLTVTFYTSSQSAGMGYS